jgi:hypothetical protein
MQEKLEMLVMLIGFPLALLYALILSMLGKLPGEGWGPMATICAVSFRCGIITIAAVVLVIAFVIFCV